MNLNFNHYKDNYGNIDLFIKAKLQSFGIKPTGSQKGDIEAIKNIAGNSSFSEDAMPAIREFVPPPPKTPEAIAVFMKKIGLEPANCKEIDDALINSRLSELEKTASTPEQKTFVAGLKGEFESIKAMAGSLGVDIMSSMNKSFFKLK